MTIYRVFLTFILSLLLIACGGGSEGGLVNAPSAPDAQNSPIIGQSPMPAPSASIVATPSPSVLPNPNNSVLPSPEASAVSSPESTPESTPETTPSTEATPEPSPVIDECDFTSQCRSVWGETATDCRNSGTLTSVCMCGSEPCSDVFNGGGGENGGGESGVCSVEGDLNQWHKVSVICQGYEANESIDATYKDLRFDVRFYQGEREYWVPGHFAADGDAANSGAALGDVWRAHFMPPKTGAWNYEVSFREGNNIAASLTRDEGNPLTVFDGESGRFNVADSAASGRDMRARGLLRHIDGERYLRFAGDNSVYIEAGMDSPENIFGYADFDNTTKHDNVGSCKGVLHRFSSHEADWDNGDPTWNGGKGKSLIGLLNYISGRGVNAVYVMAMTANGDGCDAHPWVEYSGNRRHFDVSKLDQWELAFSHMSQKGLLIHMMTQETENDQLLNGGDLGLERKLYYRELISRFAHHPALQWNLGEENTNTAAQEKAFADYIRALDPYKHAIFMHTYPGEHDRYEALLGHETIDGPTFQFGGIPESASGGVYGKVLEWAQKSADAGNPWVITMTEASGGQAPTPNTSVTKRQRVYWMWANIMAGGAGFEWYLKNNGSGHAYDLAVEDLREFDAHWQQSGHVATFFRDVVQGGLNIDLQAMQASNELTSTTDDWVLANEGEAYLIYLRNGGATNLSLPDNASYKRLWFNPRTGETHNDTDIQGPGAINLGAPPSESSSDWVLLVYKQTASSSAYNEQNGLVIIDVENTDSDLDLWQRATDIANYSGSGYLEFLGNNPQSGPAASPLTYSFRINKAGLYYLDMHIAKVNMDFNGKFRSDIANDAYVRLDGDYSAGPEAGNAHGNQAPLSALTSNTKFYGGQDNNFVWASGNRLDLGGHNNKRVAIYDLKAGQDYVFTLSGRSKFFKVDRVMFRHQDNNVSAARDLSNSETR
ncbi:DUF5060 domain-containing protein [Agaribacterium sp. ZY112]|uniref:DUF5060 domain-containing protein n=1 Tax=Agaribacterium sp. ZY112 TaxID=3233574 RepID=UPI00352663DA